jgi:hypothetical protein
MAFGEEREQLVLRAFFDESVLRNGLLELRIGDDDLARVHVGGVDAQFAEGRGDDAAGEQLAKADDQVGDARREFEERRQSAQNLIERVELLIVNLFDQGGGVCDQGRGCVAVARAQPRTDGQRSGAVACTAVAAARSSWSVTLAMALTTTTGCLPSATRPATMAAVRPMAAGSSTDVPPNFITTRFMRVFLKAVLSSQFFASNSVCCSGYPDSGSQPIIHRFQINAKG